MRRGIVAAAARRRWRWWSRPAGRSPSSTGAGLDAAVHRRLAEQQPPRPHPRLQRPRPAQRQRDRQRRRRRRAAAAGARPACGRMFDSAHGGQISWLLPAALILLGGRPGADRAAPRAPTAAAPGSCSGAAGCSSPSLVFSFMQGIFHEYYTVALAPAIGAMVGMGAARSGGPGAHRRRVTLAGGDRRHRRWSSPARPQRRLRCPGCAGWCWSAVWSAAVLLSAYACRRASPRSPRGRAGLGAGRARGVRVQTAADGPHRLDPVGRAGGGRAAWAVPGWSRPAPHPGRHPGAPRGTAARPAAATGGTHRRHRTGGPAPAARRGRAAPGGRGGGRGLLNGATASAEMTALLATDADSYTWVAAAVGSQNASGYQLATGQPVMAIGGFNGSDPSPDAGPVPAVRRRRQDPLLHGGGGTAAGGGNWRQRPARRSPVGSGQLHRHHGRRHHGLRPDGPTTS